MSTFDETRMPTVNVKSKTGSRDNLSLNDLMSCNVEL